MNREEYISILETENANYKKENKKLQSNWNSLREWLQEAHDCYFESINTQILLDKMNELEGDNN